MKKVSKADIKAKYIEYIQKGGKPSVNAFCEKTRVVRQNLYNHTTKEERDQWAKEALEQRSIVLSKATDKAGEKISDTMAEAQVDIWKARFNDAIKGAKQIRAILNKSYTSLEKAIPTGDPGDSEEASQYGFKTVQAIDALSKAVKLEDDLLKLASRTTTVDMPTTAEIKAHINKAVLTADAINQAENKKNDSGLRLGIKESIQRKMELAKSQQMKSGLKIAKKAE